MSDLKAWSPAQVLEHAEFKLSLLPHKDSLSCDFYRGVIASIKELQMTQSATEQSAVPTMMGWDKLAERGLVFRINYEILHPLGLAMTYDANTGLSNGAHVASDGVWSFSDEVMSYAANRGWVK